MAYPEITPNRAIIESGSLGLDICLGCGGYLPGTIVEITGLPETGKTTLGLHAIANAQQSWNYCAWIDANQDFYPPLAAAYDVQLSHLLYCAPISLEQALETVILLAKSAAIPLIVVDSITALLPNLEESAKHPDNQASIEYFSNTLKRISNTIRKYGTTVIFTTLFDPSLSNTYHLLSKQMGRLSLHLHATTRIRLRTSSLSSKPESFDRRVDARLIKNRGFSSRNSTEFDIIAGRGIHRQAEVFELGLSENLVTSQKSGYYFGQEYLGATINEAVCCLDNNRPLCDRIETAIRRRSIPLYDPAALEY